MLQKQLQQELISVSIQDYRITGQSNGTYNLTSGITMVQGAFIHAIHAPKDSLRFHLLQTCPWDLLTRLEASLQSLVLNRPGVAGAVIQTPL